MSAPRRSPKASSFCLREFFLGGIFISISCASLAVEDTAWLQSLWGEHLSALEERGVNVDTYREKTLRLRLMGEPNDGAALAELMQFHAQRNSVLSSIIAHHLLTLKEASLDQKILDLARAEKSNWDESLKKTSNSASSYAEFTWPKIELALKQGQYPKAEQLLLDMLYDYPGDEKSLRFLAQLYLFNHEWRLADIVYELLQTQGFEDVEILNNRILLQTQLVGPEVGVKGLEELEARYPNEAAIIQNRAVLAGQLHNREHDLLLAGRWAQIDRKNPEALKYYGQKLLDSKSWIFARDAFSRAIRLHPESNDLEALWGLAQAEAGMGEYNKCIHIIQNIKSLSSPASFQQELSLRAIPDEVREKFTPKGAE